MPNPKPKKREMFDPSSYARSFAPLSLDTLAGICRASLNDSARVAAANSILDRAYGKATQSTELNADIQITIRTLLDPNTAQLVDVTPNERALPGSACNATDADKRK